MTVTINADPDVLSRAERLLAEGLMPLAQAARKVPSFRGGRPTSPGCLWRWATQGAKAADGSIIKLETVTLLQRLATSEAALSRFLARLTAVATPGDRPPPSAPPGQRRRAAESAGRELEQLGL
jgi:hypothetical protein